MASFWYFIVEILFQSDSNKLQHHPSTFLFNLPYFLLEYVFIRTIVNYCFPSLSPDASWYFIILLFIIWVTSGTIIIALSMDLFSQIRLSMIGDLSVSLSYDFRNKSAIYGASYMEIEELLAHHECWFNDDNSICGCCGSNYIHDDMVYDKSLLRCGHLFHKQCLNQHERDLWDNDIWKYSLSGCPDCHGGYHVHSQKWDYDENYFKKIPWYLRPYQVFGEDTIISLYWDVIDKEYEKYNNQVVSRREWFMVRCIKSIDAIAERWAKCMVEGIEGTVKWGKYFMANHLSIFE